MPENDEPQTTQEREFLDDMKGLALDVKVTQIETGIWMTLVPILNNKQEDPTLVLIALLNVVKQFVMASPLHATGICLSIVQRGVMQIYQEIRDRQ
jgi:hypothetical protein